MTFPVTAAISAVKWGAVIAVLTLALVTYRQMEEDKRNLRDSLITSTAEKISAQSRSQELANVNRALESVLEVTKESMAVSNAAITELRHRNEIAQEEAETQRQVLNDVERLQSVANKRTSLLERMVNRATKERFDELEEIFNSG